MARTLILVAWAIAAAAAVPEFVEDAADKVTAEFKRRGRSGTNYRTIVVEWSPASLVKDQAAIDLTQQIVEIKAGDGDWTRPEESPIPKRGKYRQTFDNVAPCKIHRFRFVVSGLDGSEATFEYPDAVGPAAEEDILASRFTPNPPANVEVTAMEGSKLLVSWAASDCATSYEVYGTGTTSKISGNTEETSIVLENAESCETYDIQVTALTGQELSEDTTTEFVTGPSRAAGEKLEVEVVPQVNSVTASWDGWQALSCVEHYSVELCKDGECDQSVPVDRAPSFGGSSVFTPETELEECTQYTLKVKPLFQGLDLPAKTIAFSTRAPAIEDVEAKLGSVTAVAGEEQMVTIGWSPVKCATSYEVFYRQAVDGSDWEELESVEANGLEVKGVPCTKYSYGVKVTINGEQSQLVEAEGGPVEVPLDPRVAYTPPGLQLVPSVAGLRATWEHAQCISHYRVEVCKAGSADCHNPAAQLTDSNGHQEQSISLDTLEPCSEYTIKIIATNNQEELGAEERTFTTLSPAAAAPTDLTTSLNTATGQIDVSFSPVQCASGYKIYQKLDDGAIEFVLDTTATTTALAAPEPCSTYSIGVSSLVSGEDSGVGELQEGSVPAKRGDGTLPGLKILKTENMTIEFLVKTPLLNQKCMVAAYEVKYIKVDVMSEQETRTLFPSESEDGILLIEDFPGAADNGMSLEARIKYSDGVLSPWVSSKDPTIDDTTADNPDGLMVPVVIGILLAVVVLVVVIFFIVKRRKSQTKYDPESAQNDDETKQLKESNPAA